MAAQNRRAVPQAKFQGPHSTNTDTAAREWLYNADDTFLLCRGDHRFPKLRFNEPLAKGIDIVGPYRDGVYEIVQTCPDCGVKRKQLTKPRAAFDMDGGYRYSDYPEGYRAPKGAKITPRQAKEEVWRRGKNVFLRYAIKPATTAPAKEEPAAPAPQAESSPSVRDRLEAAHENQVQVSRERAATRTRSTRATRSRKE